MIEPGDFVLMRNWYNREADNGHLICLYETKTGSLHYKFTLYPFAAKSQVNTKLYLNYNSGWGIEALKSYRHSEVTIVDIIKCDMYNDLFMPQFKIFFRKLIEKEFSNESPKYTHSNVHITY